MGKEEEAILECYTRLFANSEPPANFQELVDNAPLNGRGKKEFDYTSYKIDEEKYNKIVEGVVKKYKFNGKKVQNIKNIVALGCSPVLFRPARYEHDCNNCEYLGRYREYDLYFCGREPTVLARYSDQGSDYISGLVFADPDISEVLYEAKNRAEKASLISK